MPRPTLIINKGEFYISLVVFIFFILSFNDIIVQNDDVILTGILAFFGGFSLSLIYYNIRYSEIKRRYNKWRQKRAKKRMFQP
mgnify:CR=1 FL=1